LGVYGGDASKQCVGPILPQTPLRAWQYSSAGRALFGEQIGELLDGIAVAGPEAPQLLSVCLCIATDAVHGARGIEVCERVQIIGQGVRKPAGAAGRR
jgi:hypothetical protein